MLRLFKQKNQKCGTAKILIVDDSQQILDILQTRLNGFDYECFTAENGKEGLEKAEAEKPDLILLDVDMPVMNGYRTLRQLRNNSNLKDTPVIMVTKFYKAEDIAIANSYGISDYVVKPFSHLELLDKIVEVLNN